MDDTSGAGVPADETGAAPGREEVSELFGELPFTSADGQLGARLRIELDGEPRFEIVRACPPLYTATVHYNDLVEKWCLGPGSDEASAKLRGYAERILQYVHDCDTALRAAQACWTPVEPSLTALVTNAASLASDLHEGNEIDLADRSRVQPIDEADKDALVDALQTNAIWNGAYSYFTDPHADLVTMAYAFCGRVEDFNERMRPAARRLPNEMSKYAEVVSGWHATLSSFFQRVPDVLISLHALNSSLTAIVREIDDIAASRAV